MIKTQFQRNLGILSEREMEKLQNTTIAIAGCGCIGGFAAELLTRMGIGRLLLADPDTFDETNINRQSAANHRTVGQLKVKALSEHLLEIHPELQVTLYDEGITRDNVAEFVAEADYVIDAIDYFELPSAVTLHRASRAKGLYVTTAVALGFGTAVLTFDPNGIRLEQYIGLPEDISDSELENIMFPPASYSSSLPGYATAENIEQWLNLRTIPTISVGQALGPGALVSQMVLHLLGRKQPRMVPDSFQLQFE